MSTPEFARRVRPDSFEAEAHFYPKVLNAQIHPLVRFFMGLSNSRIVERYCHLHPEVKRDAIESALREPTRHLLWGGADLFHVTTDRGERRMVVIESNSCPSGQKSMPRYQEEQEMAGYQRLLERAFLPTLKRRRLPAGGLAVLYDKNPMENTGYAATLAELTGEDVHLVYWPADDPDPAARFDAGVLEVRTVDGWIPIRAAFRYVTQRPWTRIPPVTRTALLNPTLACLGGGRNKMLAAKAYDLHNATLAGTGLQIRVPETIWDVSLNEIPLWVDRMGGVAVVKDPYSNAGQGVWTITSAAELAEFTAADHRYDRFIVQALIGNSGWSSRGRDGRLHHVGTVPDRHNRIHVADLRFMVGVGAEGFFPIATYARRAPAPLLAELDGSTPSWEMLGTNLSDRAVDGTWTTDPSRLLLMDARDFNRLGLGLDQLIEGYVQTALAVRAIDSMCATLLTRKGRFRRKLFSSLNPDPALVAEIIETSPPRPLAEGLRS
jgi:hypothetical protein